MKSQTIQPEEWSRTNPRPTQLDRHSQLWFSNTPSTRTIILDRHSLATVFSYLQTKERIRVSQVSHQWYDITIDPIAWATDQYLFSYFNDFAPDTPRSRFHLLTSSTPPRLPLRYRRLIRRLDFTPPYLSGKMNSLSDWVSRAKAKRSGELVTAEDEILFRTIPQPILQLAKSATSVLQDCAHLTEMELVAYEPTEKLIAALCRAFFELPSSALPLTPPNQSSTSESAALITPPTQHPRAIKKVFIRLPQATLLPLILQSPRMQQLESLEINLLNSPHHPLPSLNHLQQLQQLILGVFVQVKSECWDSLHQLPELRTLVCGVNGSVKMTLPATLTSLTLLLERGDTFAHDLFPSLGPTSSPHLRHLTIKLNVLADRHLQSHPIQVQHREALLRRIGTLTTLETLTIHQREDDVNTHRLSLTRVVDLFTQLHRCNRSSLEIERLVLFGNCTISTIHFTRKQQPSSRPSVSANSSESISASASELTVFPVNDRQIQLNLHFLLLAPHLTSSFKHLSLSITFDSNKLQAFNQVLATVQLESLTLNSLWLDHHVTSEALQLLFDTIGSQTQLSAFTLMFLSQPRLTFESDINKKGCGVESLLRCRSLTSIRLNLPRNFIQLTLFPILGQLPHLLTLDLMMYFEDVALIPQLLPVHSPLQHLTITFHDLRPNRSSPKAAAAASRALLTTLRPHATRLKSIRINDCPLAEWESIVTAVEHPRCLIQ